MLKLFGGKALLYLGAFTLVMILVIILFSMIGGITYDTSTDDNWTWIININFGEGVEKLRDRIRGANGSEDKENENDLFNSPIKGPFRDRPLLNFPPRPFEIDAGGDNPIRAELEASGHYRPRNIGPLGLLC